MTAQAYQLDLHYNGKEVSVTAALRGDGWGWAALIDLRRALEHAGEAFPTPELAIADGKLTVEDYLDSDDDW